MTHVSSLRDSVLTHAATQHLPAGLSHVAPPVLFSRASLRECLGSMRGVASLKAQNQNMNTVPSIAMLAYQYAGPPRAALSDTLRSDFSERQASLS
jgi:hypothetical protein